MLLWIKRLFDRSGDPVHGCDLYRDKAAGSCSHVDGPLCDFPHCSMLDEYRKRATPPQPGDSGRDATPAQAGKGE